MPLSKVWCVAVTHTAVSHSTWCTSWLVALAFMSSPFSVSVPGSAQSMKQHRVPLIEIQIVDGRLDILDVLMAKELGVEVHDPHCLTRLNVALTHSCNRHCIAS